MSAGPMHAEIAHLGNLALRFGKSIEWDAVNRCVLRCRGGAKLRWATKRRRRRNK